MRNPILLNRLKISKGQEERRGEGIIEGIKDTLAMRNPILLNRLKIS